MSSPGNYLRIALLDIPMHNGRSMGVLLYFVCCLLSARYCIRYTCKHSVRSIENANTAIIGLSLSGSQ